MSYLEELRKSSPTLADDVTNDNKVNTDERDVAAPEGVDKQDTDINKDMSSAKEIEGALQLVEVRNVLENEKSLEQNSPMVGVVLDIIEKQYGIAVESSDEPLGDRIEKKSTSIFSRIKNFFGNIKDSIDGINEIPEILSHMKNMDKEGIKQFEKEISSERITPYSDKSGKILNPQILIKEINKVESILLAGFEKFSNELYKAATNNDVKSNGQWREIASGLVQKSGIAGKTFHLPGMIIEVSNDASLSVDITEKKDKEYLKMSHSEAIKYLESIQSGWQEFKKLADESEKRWRNLSNTKLADAMTENDVYVQDAVFTHFHTLYAGANAAYRIFLLPKKQIKHTLNLIKASAASVG